MVQLGAVRRQLDKLVNVREYWTIEDRSLYLRLCAEELSLLGVHAAPLAARP
jgi:hypothetical protein